MPEAIATTKRKFYKALDAINSNTNLRPERATKRLRRSNSAIMDSTITLKTPQFAPWSQPSFLERLKTFSSVSMWHPKPEVIGEVEWAKRGWVCVDVNTVACKGGCEQRVVVKFSSPYEETESEDEEATNALVDRYKELIVYGHTELCLWREAGCKDNIYRLSVIQPSIWQPQLRQRLQSLQSISETIDSVAVKGVSDGLHTLPPDDILVGLPTNILGSDEAQKSSKTAAKLLQVAMHGWHGASDTGNDLLHCNACFQRIGLWMYQRCETEDKNQSDHNIIDLVSMHREHCPWRNPQTQQATDTLAGKNACEILSRVCSTFVREKTRKSGGLYLEGTASEDARESRSISRQDIEEQDRVRDSRLRRIKTLFTTKKRKTNLPKA
ncbi:zf-C3HC-domain-containing protein [Piedraia hortae CBS 480.64]|uniref:Zf-C3HC-domain-containing protein n=1 Tax=Piedraia hortae CBS 480.64 TaxID=1314780 RepID=A0A6A7BZB6_9PEZI|nr:zf-C3HC-domain-containing protein [Piedraia hortae CBS 480.64]